MGAVVRILIIGGVVAVVLLGAGMALVAVIGAVVSDVVSFETEHDDERAVTR